MNAIPFNLRENEAMLYECLNGGVIRSSFGSVSVNGQGLKPGDEKSLLPNNCYLITAFKPARFTLSTEQTLEQATLCITRMEMNFKPVLDFCYSSLHEMLVPFVTFSTASDIIPQTVAQYLMRAGARVLVVDQRGILSVPSLFQAAPTFSASNPHVEIDAVQLLGQAAQLVLDQKVVNRFVVLILLKTEPESAKARAKYISDVQSLEQNVKERSDQFRIMHIVDSAYLKEVRNDSLLLQLNQQLQMQYGGLGTFHQYLYGDNDRLNPVNVVMKPEIYQIVGEKLLPSQLNTLQDTIYKSVNKHAVLIKDKKPVGLCEVMKVNVEDGTVSVLGPGDWAKDCDIAML